MSAEVGAAPTAPGAVAPAPSPGVEASTAMVRSEVGANGQPPAENPPTPWFLYIMSVLVIGLAILIALFCAALSDPEFPSRSHRGPNLGEPTLADMPSKRKPVTGAAALPHEIPFLLHRPPPAPKASHFVRPSDSAQVALNYTPLGHAPYPKDEGACPMCQTTPHTTPHTMSHTTLDSAQSVATQDNAHVGPLSNLQRAAGVIQTLAHNPAQITVKSVVAPPAEPHDAPVPQTISQTISQTAPVVDGIPPGVISTGAPLSTGASVATVTAEPEPIMLHPAPTSLPSISTAGAAPFVGSVEISDDGSVTIAGSNFDDDTRVLFTLTSGPPVGAMCSAQPRSMQCRAAAASLTGASRLSAVTVTNSDSQSFTYFVNPTGVKPADATGGTGRHISFTAVPRRLAVNQTVDVSVVLYDSQAQTTNGPVTIWFEVLKEEDGNGDPTDSISSRDRYEPIVLHEWWADVQNGRATFTNIGFDEPGKYTFRATAVSTTFAAAPTPSPSPSSRDAGRTTQRHVVAPIIESYPILVQ